MTKPPSFETAMAELETIVAQLEKGELTLDDSLQQFEKGIALVRTCQDKLAHAEQRIEQITQKQSPTADHD